MAYPVSGLMKIYPSTVSIVNGQWALNNDSVPQPNRDVADLQAYYDLRTGVLANAPITRRATEFPPASGSFVPSVGAYELQFFPSTIGIEFYDGSYPSPVVATLDFLDADFPVGITISNPNIWWIGTMLIGPNRDRTIDSLLFKFFGSTVRTYSPAPNTYSGETSGNTSIIPNPFMNWSFLQIMKPFGLAVNVASTTSANTGIPRLVISECFILAVYNTQSFNISTTTPNVLPGDIANITDGDNGLDAMDGGFKIYWDTLPGEEDVPNFPGWTGGIVIPQNLILERTTSFLKFIMPNDLGIPYGGRRLMLTGTSTNPFRLGEFPLQNYNITLVDSSGLYTLIPGKRNDTYYDRSVTPVVTTDLKIPDPRVKSGFFNA